MASTLLETLNNIENGRKHCISEAKAAGYATTDNMSVYDIGNLFSQKPTGEAIDGWQRPSDWWDCETILANAQVKDGLYPAYILLLADWDRETTFAKEASYKSTQGNGFLTSDGAWYIGDATHTWDTTKDKPCSEGYKTRYVIVYMENLDIPTKEIDLSRFYCLEAIFGNVSVKNISFGNSHNKNKTIQSLIYTGTKNLYSKVDICYRCYNLKKISLPNLISINSQFAFSDCSKLTDVFLPNFSSYDYNGTYTAFTRNYSLKKISLPKLEKGSTYFFSSCNSLESASLPILKKIESYFFQNCLSLKEIFIPSVVEIGDRAFLGCTSLERFDFLSTYQTINFTDLFKGCYSLHVINLYNDWNKSGLSVTNCPLTRPCLLDMLDKLKDVTNEESAFTLTLGATNIAKLTEEEIAVGTNKGWVIN